LQHHPQVTLATTDGLKEIGHGEWEGLYEHEIESGYPGMLQQWQEKPETVQMPGKGGESLEQVWARAIATWNDIVAQYSHTETPVTVLVSPTMPLTKPFSAMWRGWGQSPFGSLSRATGPSA
jgi:broad specificity phosphatase PhoE